MKRGCQERSMDVGTERREGEMAEGGKKGKCIRESKRGEEGLDCEVKNARPKKKKKMLKIWVSSLKRKRLVNPIGRYNRLHNKYNNKKIIEILNMNFSRNY